MKIAFLIEGYKLDYKCRSIQWAINLAKKNSALIFDIIESCSPIHLSEALRLFPKKEWAFCVLGWITTLENHGRDLKNIITLIKWCFENLIKEGHIKKIPTYLENLYDQSKKSKLNFEKAKVMLDKHIPKEYTSSDKIEKFSQKLNKIMNETSNKLSRINFLKWLEKNKEVREIFVYVGENHIDFCDSIEKVKIIKKSNDMRRLCVNIFGKNVYINIFRVTHRDVKYYESDVKHYESMEQFAKGRGLIIPKNTSQIIQDTSQIIQDTSQIIQEDLLQTNRGLVNDLLLAWSYANDALKKLIERGEKKPVFSSKFPKKQFSEKKFPKKVKFDLHKCVQKFDFWMKYYNHFNTTDTQELYAWLHADRGSRLVSEYSDFCKLAEALKKKKYNIIFPLSEFKFKENMKIAHSREKEYSMI